MIGDTGPVDISMLEINANAHYYFTKSESANFYALGGLQFASISSSFDLFGVSQSTSATEIGLNIGAGANFNLGGFNLLPEVKFTLGGTEQLHLGVSAMFPI